MKQYRNVFAELGKTEEQIEKRLSEIVDEFFFGEDKVYHPVGDDMAYIEDTGNHDARTEGMSYGMMMCVQLDMKEEFDRLWKWSKTYMYMSEGDNEGYFAWSCKTNGEKNSYGPAPDGEGYSFEALAGGSARASSTILTRQGRYSAPASIKARTAERAPQCGTGKTS